MKVTKAAWPVVHALNAKRNFVWQLDYCVQHLCEWVFSIWDTFCFAASLNEVCTILFFFLILRMCCVISFYYWLHFKTHVVGVYFSSVCEGRDWIIGIRTLIWCDSFLSCLQTSSIKENSFLSLPAMGALGLALKSHYI